MSDDARRAAVRRRSAELLESSGGALARSYARQIPEQLWEVPPVEPQRSAPQPTPQPAPPARDWAAERKWIVGIVKATARDPALEPVVKEIGTICGKLNRRITDLEDRLAKSEAATVELILELERKVAELEQRAVMKPPPKPKLVDENAA